jgi:hypothetical protein
MPGNIIFVCTADGCDAGPWEGSHDAMAHCAEQRGHAYTGKPRDEYDGEVIPATPTEEQDHRNLHHKGDPKGALAGE